MSEPKPLNIYQKIVEIRKTVNCFSKDGSGHNYKYVTGSQVLGKIKNKMDELGVVLEPHLLNQNHHTHTYKTKYGEATDFVITGDMKMIWINADDPVDRSEVHWQFAGQQDDISQALGSGLTYTERYFLLKYFGAPTDEDDPDAKKPKQDNKQQPTQGKPNESATGLTEGQIKRAFAKAKANGRAKEDIDKWIKAKFGKTSINDLTKTEYDQLCDALDKPKQ